MNKFLLPLLAWTMQSQAIPLQVGELVPTSELLGKMTLASLQTDRAMCSPAVLVGPRTFLTAAHCTPLIPADGRVRVRGPGIDQVVRVSVASTALVSDDEFFSGKACRELLAKVPDASTLTPEQQLACWFADGQADVALLVAEREFSSPMLTLANEAAQVGETLRLLGQNPSCGGDDGFFQRLRLKVFGFQGAQIVLDGRNMGEDQSNAYRCGGNSGGIYYRKQTDGSLGIVGLHSAGVKATGPYEIHGKRLFLTPNFFGGANLFDPGVRDWLRSRAEELSLRICGLNLNCAAVVP